MRRAVSRFIPNKTRVLNSSVVKGLRLDLNSVDDFYITLDEPHRVWTPGDEISGQIVLILKKNLINVCVSLSLCGYIKIKPSASTNIRNKKYHLFNHTINIYGDQEIDSNLSDDDNELKNGLSKGEHRFPFIVKLPTKNIHTSVDFGRGSIAYLVKCSIDSSTSPTPTTSENSDDDGFFGGAKIRKEKVAAFHSCEKLINIISPINVAKLPPPKPKTLIVKNPRKLSKTISSTSTLNSLNTVSSNTSDKLNSSSVNSSAVALSISDQQAMLSKIRLTMDLASRGYLRGELIPVKIRLQHIKKLQDSTGIIVTLVRICRVDNGPDLIVESFRKDLAQSIAPLFVDPVNFSSEINTSVRVPADAFPTIAGCPLVSFQYFIEVLVNLSGKVIDSVTPTKEYTNGSATPTTMEIINTDKLKRMKNVLQVTMEVVVGTERNLDFRHSPKSLSNSNLSSAKHSPITSRRNSSSTNNSPRPIENVDYSHQTDTYNNEFRTIPEQSSVSFQLPDHHNNRSMRPRSPSRLSNEILVSSTLEEVPSAPPIPNYMDSQSSYGNNLRWSASPSSSEQQRISSPPLLDSNLSEKEILRIREESLLPSQPMLDLTLPDGTVGSSHAPSAPAMNMFRSVSDSPPSSRTEEHEDKLELERGRLLGLESEPPVDFSSSPDFDEYEEIDFVPMYENVKHDELIGEQGSSMIHPLDMHRGGSNITLSSAEVSVATVK